MPVVAAHATVASVVVAIGSAASADAPVQSAKRWRGCPGGTRACCAPCAWPCHRLLRCGLARPPHRGCAGVLTALLCCRPPYGHELGWTTERNARTAPPVPTVTDFAPQSGGSPWAPAHAEPAPSPRLRAPTRSAPPPPRSGSRWWGVRRNAVRRWRSGHDDPPVEHPHGLGVRAGGPPDAIDDPGAPRRVLVRQSSRRAPREPHSDRRRHPDRGDDDDHGESLPHDHPFYVMVCRTTTGWRRTPWHA